MQAAGMESDFSDSDCDMVFSDKISAPTETEQYVPITFSNSANKSNTSANHSTSQSYKSDHGSYNSRNSKSSRFHPQNRSRRPCVDPKSSQLLDELRFSIVQGNLEATQKILDQGVFVDSVLKSGWTGLMYACSAGYPDIVDLVLKKGADPNYHKDMFTPLMAVCASQKNEKDLAKCSAMLLEKNANVNAHERHMTTPLIFAAKEGHLSVVEQLLDKGANPNAQDNYGKTALGWAAFNGHGKVIRLLVEKGADVNILNNMGQSPADIAYERGHNEINSMLLNGSFSQAGAIDDKLGSDKPNGDLCKPFRNGNQKSFVKVGELELFLSGIGLSDFTSKFVEHELKFSDLLVMDDEELEKIGINQVGVRKKILDACKSVHKKDWENSSLPNLKERQFISCPDAVAMMGNIAKHLKYISCTVMYIRQQIQSQPRILELSQDSANVHNLLDEMEDSLKNARNLNDELRFMKMHLEKVQDQHQYIPADMIVETVPRSRTQYSVFFAVFGVITVSAVFSGLVWKYPEILSKVPEYIRIRLPFSSSLVCD